uniref:Uncharacterized protein n=1 Tax=Aegilops tauschii subsp. strangulata TaxID=200361 RepID=A0A452YTQ2_AEGTS
PATASAIWRRRRQRVGEMASSTPAPAAPPEKGGSPPGEGLEGGLFSVQDWEEFRVRSKQIIHRAVNRGRCLALARSRAAEIPSVLAGQPKGHPR